MCIIFIEGQKSMRNEHRYFLLGVICHIGENLKEGHYTCYILEQIQNITWYHHMDKDSHVLVGHDNFELDVNRNGYIFLYGRNEASSFKGNPYQGHRIEFNSLENKYLHVFRKRGKARSVKSKRQSDLGMVEKTDLSQLLPKEGNDIFDIEDIQDSNASNCIEEIHDTREREIGDLLAKNMEVISHEESGSAPGAETAITVVASNETLSEDDVIEKMSIGKDLPPQKSQQSLQPLVDQVNEQYNQGNSDIDAIIISERYTQF